MNHECFGRFYRPLRLYRCLADGRYVQATEIPPTCPACGRATDHVTIVDLPRVREALLVEVEHDGRWEALTRVTREVPATPAVARTDIPTTPLEVDLAEAIRRIADSWVQGDLAGAVRDAVDRLPSDFRDDRRPGGG